MSMTCGSLLPQICARQEICDAEDVRVGGLMQGVRQLDRCCGVGILVYKTG